MRILVANAGSSSRRYALYDGGAAVATAHLERKGEGYQATVSGSERPTPITAEGFREGPGYFLESLLRSGAIRGPSDIDGIALRVVAPGTFFQKHAPIDGEYLKALEAAASLAPLHAAPVLGEAEAWRSLLPGAPMIGISDSAFHASMPAAAREYALPAEDADRFDVRRFGYHGISAQSILRKLKKRGLLPERIVLCHLGSGASILAIRDGKSADASMGFSPLEGLVMGSRAGDMDPAAALQLGRKLGLDAQDLEKYLNTRCGLLGLSGSSADMRRLLQGEADGDARAASAVEAFVYRARKYIGAFAAALGGMDLLVFTAAIGERSPVIRARICQGLDWMRVHLDPSRNAAAVARDALLHLPGSTADIAVVMTDEMAEMAEMAELARQSAWRGLPIP